MSSNQPPEVTEVGSRSIICKRYLKMIGHNELFKIQPIGQGNAIYQVKPILASS